MEMFPRSEWPALGRVRLGSRQEEKPLLHEDFKSLRGMEDLRASSSKNTETPKSEIFRVPCRSVSVSQRRSEGSAHMEVHQEVVWFQISGAIRESVSDSGGKGKGMWRDLCAI
jgi:hypothetical protein